MPELRKPGDLVSLDADVLRSRLAGVTGAVLLALAAIGFAFAGEWVQELHDELAQASPYGMAIATPFVFMGVVWCTRRWFLQARGSGIPQVIAAARMPDKIARHPLLSLKTACAKLAGTLAILLAGGAVGREGPTVQISAAIMVAVHRWLRVPMRAGVIIAGGAAGVAAAFNTPLAGVAFAIEELAAAFEQRVALLVMATVMIAGMVSLGLAGDYVYFGAMAQALPVREMVLIAPVAGIFGGIAGGLFARAMLGMTFSPIAWIARLRARPLLLAGICGTVVGLLALVTQGQTSGTGYGMTRALLRGEDAPLYLAPARFAATLATSLSGAAGGIFAPSLSVGAGFGQLLKLAFPESSSGAVILLGMIGYFTGVVRAPLTASIIMMEMTADRTMVLPLFATALIADWISSIVCRPKLYHSLAAQFDEDRQTEPRK